MADIRGLGGGTGARAPSEGDFGGKLVDQVGELTKTQTEAADSARSLADGTATDVSQVVMDVERARLAMQLASQIRTRGLEAFQDVFNTQV
jgi:flagellar hook-basal body complex protein FliE